ncbi:hypothetical protein Rhal01_03826 [Rubritalea halochordaticola]|uniref:Uncharacterized protein n=1 Tax=Rubritalea halochordaticola TaxID=714537 RepID=A0ABP9V6L1_9BACT
MESSGNSNKSSILIPNIAVLVLVTFGLMSRPSSTPTERPSGGMESASSKGSTEWYYARPTDDPVQLIKEVNAQDGLRDFPSVFANWYVGIETFENVPKAEWRSFEQDKNSQSVPKKEIPLDERNKRVDRGLLLIVTLPDGPFAVSSEIRYRSRYAVTSALANAGYIPSKDSQLGLATKWKNEVYEDATSIKPPLIAYEEYRPYTRLANWKRVCYSKLMVCYLPESTLAELTPKLQDSLEDKSPNQEAQIRESLPEEKKYHEGENPLLNLITFINSIQQERDAEDKGHSARCCDLQVIGLGRSEMYRSILARAVLIKMLNDDALFKQGNAQSAYQLKWTTFQANDAPTYPEFRSPRSTISRHHLEKYIIDTVYSDLLKYQQKVFLNQRADNEKKLQELFEYIQNESLRKRLYQSYKDDILDYYTLSGKDPKNKNSEFRTRYPKERITKYLTNKLKYTPSKTLFLNTSDEKSTMIQHPLGYIISRGTADDELLCLALAGEIKQRGMKNPKLVAKADDDTAQDSILVIAESDTSYGRSMVQSFIRACYQTFDPNTVGNKLLPHHPLGLDYKHRISWEDERMIHCLRFFRGIQPEGDRPSKKQSRSTDSQKLDQADEQSSNQAHKRGDQTDYINRLVLDIKEKNYYRPSQFKHIVIISSDIYDKLQILQEVKKIIPHAHYYTTDLDTLYSHPLNIPYTKNLVVASGYNLRLPDEEQLMSPPFRDSYQTTTYLETLDALGYLSRHSGRESSPFPEKISAAERKKILSNQVHLFEIGKRKAQLLQSFRVTGDGGLQTDLKERVPEDWELKPEQRMKIKVDWVFFIAALVFAIFVITPVWKYWKDLKRAELYEPDHQPTSSTAGFHGWWLILLILFWLSVFLLGRKISKISALPGEEPFSVITGISAWPATLIQILAINTAIMCIWLSARDLNRDRDKLETIFEKLLMSDERKYHRSSRVTFFRWMHDSLLFVICPQKIGDRNISLNGLWTICSNRSRQRERLARSFLYLLVSVLLLYLTCWLLKLPVPYCPVRGEDSRFWFSLVQYVSFGFSIYLTLYIVDACLLIRALNRAFLSWMNKDQREFSEGLAHGEGFHIVSRVQVVDAEHHDQKSTTHHQYSSRAGQVYDVETRLLKTAMWETAATYIASSRCKVLYRIMVYPFITYFLLILSRSNHFDHFYWIPQLVTPILVVVLALIWASYDVKHTSTEMYKIALYRVNRELELIQSERQITTDFKETGKKKPGLPVVPRIYGQNLSDYLLFSRLLPAQDEEWINRRSEALKGDLTRLSIYLDKLAPGILHSPLLKGLSYPAVASILYYFTGKSM